MIIDSSMTMILWRRLQNIVIISGTMIYYYMTDITYVRIPSINDELRGNHCGI